MPVRDDLRKSVITKSLDSSAAASNTVTSVRVLGTYQNISNLNNVGRFTPGQFRSNPVIIKKYTGIAAPANFFYSWSHLGTDYTTRLTGDWAAQHLAIWNPLAQCDSIGTWDVGRSNVALVKVYSKMNKPDLDVGTILGELRETLAGLGSPMSALREFLYPYKRGSRGRKLSQLLELRKTSIGTVVKGNLRDKSKGRTGSEFLDMGAGSWLELRYGIMPLIKTIDDIIAHAESITRNLCGKMLRKRSKVTWKKRGKWNLGLPYPSYDGANGPISHYVWPSVEWSAEMKTVASLFYQIPRPPSLTERLGLTASDIPSIAWELMLLSFVWDWFISVGDWLQSMKVQFNRVVLGITVSQKTVVRGKCTIDRIHRAYPKDFRIYMQNEAHFTYERLERQVNLTKPVLPPLKREGLSLLRTLDALTLTWQRMPKMNWR